MKVIYSLFLLAILLFIIFPACKKDNSTPVTVVCDVTGIYSGTYTNQFGQSGNFAYSLKSNNLIVGAANVAGLSNPNAAGSYINTCDSIYITTWNSINNSYYKFSGKFNNTRTQIAGVYVNQTTPSETGPFQLTRQ